MQCVITYIKNNLYVYDVYNLFKYFLKHTPLAASFNCSLFRIDQLYLHVLLHVSGNDCADINGNTVDESPSPTSSCYDKDQHSEEKEPEPSTET